MSARLDTERVTRAMLVANRSRVDAKPWTDAEVAFLRKHYVRRGPAWCGAKLGRTATAAKSIAGRRGISQRWSRRELVILRAEWGELSERGMCRKLPGRTWKAIANTAFRIGLRSPNRGGVGIIEASNLTGLNPRLLRKVLADAGVRWRYVIRTNLNNPNARRLMLVDPDAAAEAARAWCERRVVGLTRAEAEARTGLSTYRMQCAMQMLAATRPVDGYTPRGWSVLPADVDAAAAIYRAARGAS